MSHSICPLKTSAQHLEQVLASIFTGSTFALESFPFGCAFFTRDLDSAAVLEVVAPGGGCDGSFGTAFGGGVAFGTGSKNFAADDAAGTGLGSLVRPSSVLADHWQTFQQLGAAFGVSAFGTGGVARTAPGHLIGGDGFTFPGNFSTGSVRGCCHSACGKGR